MRRVVSLFGFSLLILACAKTETAQSDTAAMAMAPPFASMARSTTLPLTMRAREWGKSLTTLGGLPTSTALLKSVLELWVISDPPGANRT